MTFEWFVYTGHECNFCPYCGDDLVHEKRGLRGRTKLRNPDHRLEVDHRQRFDGTEYSMDMYTCWRR